MIGFALADKADDGIALTFMDLEVMVDIQPLASVTIRLTTGVKAEFQ